MVYYVTVKQTTSASETFTLLTKLGVKFSIYPLSFLTVFTGIAVDVNRMKVTCEESPEHTHLYHRGVCVYTSQDTE